MLKDNKYLNTFFKIVSKNIFCNFTSKLKFRITALFVVELK